MKTLLMIKPDAVKKRIIGKIISILEENGFEITGIKMKRFSREEAEKFYEVHKEKPFFSELIDFITSDSVVGIRIEGEDIVKKIRDFIGETEPKKAREGTIRNLFGESITKNVVHASDTIENAIRELKFFFED
ncbi:MAG: nucleoside-diphosphate kinase [Deltaproteobacteria bacterium]|nr:nucleoside-diphosphate kinase [candidate division WOR-3 bacterium]MCX7622119.1 nucleoside-diphosphate kinase [Acidimicrobiales bacterium]MCX7809252.1 nucleoside-diphosphate kinase [Deltaproteobacteria bacterium]MDW8150500.1 nucleoside-diphosphate kinase [candidate division WOR-3 bacterium]